MSAATSLGVSALAVVIITCERNAKEHRRRETARRRNLQLGAIAP
jgi:hypothetical protein